MKPFLEHLNMTSTDVDETVRFLLTAMPEFSIRGGGGGEKAQRWVHVGTEDSYLCVEDRGATERGPHQPYVHPGMNHIGFVVEDAAAVSRRLLEAGYAQASVLLLRPRWERVRVRPVPERNPGRAERVLACEQHCCQSVARCYHARVEYPKLYARFHPSNLICTTLCQICGEPEH